MVAALGVAWGLPASTDAGEAPRETIALSVDCRAEAVPVSPWIYGIAYAPRLDGREEHQHRLGATARRWGGNAATRFNWRLGNAFNPGADWFYRNTAYGPQGNAWERFLDENRRRGYGSALTIPALGWVAKDDASAGFPVPVCGPMKQVAPDGGGVAGDGRLVNGGRCGADPSRTSVPFVPEDAGAWIEAIRARDGASGGRAVALWLLDNEPMLWSETHRDVHPDPVTYDELLERLVSFGTAVRRADPAGRIGGPALWGWPAYHYSASDLAYGRFLRPDRRRHGDEPLLPWVLGELRRHRERTGTRVLDAVDVHFYPQGRGMGVGTAGAVDPEAAARRIRSTRALWDPEYVDESWIAEPIALLPRLRGWIAEKDPGLGVVIGEWSFGAERHPSGGLAVAEALGRFGREGVEAAFYWTYPADGSFAFHAFRAFRDFDGEGARFEEQGLAVRDAPGVSLFAARDASRRRLTLVLLNLHPSRALDASVRLDGCGLPGTRRVFVQQADRPGLRARAPGAADGARLVEPLPPWSITVVEAKLDPPLEATP